MKLHSILQDQNLDYGYLGFLKLFVQIYSCCIRVIPQGTVVNNLGPDRLVDPNPCRQTNPLIARPLSGSAWY